jgi:GNAT superfamily N-acetyltransferase
LCKFLNLNLAVAKLPVIHHFPSTVKAQTQSKKLQKLRRILKNCKIVQIFRPFFFQDGVCSQDEARMSLPEVPRFEMDADDVPSVLKYYTNRSIQYLQHGYSWDGSYTQLRDPASGEVWGVEVLFTPDKSIFPADRALPPALSSVYVLKSHRSKGHMKRWLLEASAQNKTVVTAADCQIEAYLKQRGANYVLAPECDWLEYHLVSQFYGNKVARRTQIHLMNHIDEGLYVMRRIKASEVAMRAYCLHPLCQGDEELASFFTQQYLRQIDPQVLILAIEYRRTANAHLSHADPLVPIELSPLQDVNDMLVADKVQNRKDFECSIHATAHERRNELADYFRRWIARLGVQESAYEELKRDLVRFTGRSERSTV